MLKIAAAILFVGYGSFYMMVGIALIVKVLNPDPVAIARYRQLKKLARRANKGDSEAIKNCQGNTNIKISKTWRPWGYQKHYSAHRTTLYACFPL